MDGGDDAFLCCLVWAGGDDADGPMKISDFKVHSEKFLFKSPYFLELIIRVILFLSYSFITSYDVVSWP